MGATVVTYKEKTAVPVPNILSIERMIKNSGNVIKDCIGKHMHETSSGSHSFCRRIIVGIERDL